MYCMCENTAYMAVDITVWHKTVADNWYPKVCLAENALADWVFTIIEKIQILVDRLTDWRFTAKVLSFTQFR